ncbi:hypothetical protein [Actinacidiphila oryziradicis]|uniref:DNA primase/polymerase bifunctional N-terminal domain-containing protein n=1 Tax=Actinacidiphila oryziradicis TaxID=2571141 RepID=A0A4U0SP73_9ACTN|nr:hypothetical protein [Actinacidiphila oryziradicis]TKA11834.1 hypothetical protein FCI23_08300 [Actinacidiphila oryziradicis]
MTTTSTSNAAADWLAQAQPDPGSIRQQWAACGQSLILPGRNWDAVELPGFGADSARAAADLGITGPVAHLPGAETLWVFVPPGTAAWWLPVPGITASGSGWHVRSLLLPVPDRVVSPGTYWITPPDGTGHLTDPMHLHRALAAPGVAATG